MPPAVTAHPEISLLQQETEVYELHQQHANQHAAPERSRSSGLLGRLWRERTLAFVLAWPVPLALLLIWLLGSGQGWIAQQTLPPPQMVYDTFLNLLESGELKANVAVSMVRVINGFLLGAGFGLLLGVAMGLSETLKEYLYPSFKMIAYVPLLGWLPLLIMVFGIGESLKFVLIAKASFIPITLNTYQGIRNVPAKFIEMGKVYRLNHLQLLRRIVFPAAFPSIWSGIRYGLTHSWLILVVVELLASSEGLGFMMANGQQLFQLDLVLVAVIMVGAIGYVLDKVLELVEQRLLRWRRDAF
ncbi:ABC transporter permease [Herbaspirillum lusitanum]|uniref:ABC transporter permease n=1 Tax=Herbaspirillum lusitanum TaxID=213312 RepID=A0ABW9AG56_9BURK